MVAPILSDDEESSGSGCLPSQCESEVVAGSDTGVVVDIVASEDAQAAAEDSAAVLSLQDDAKDVVEGDARPESVVEITEGDDEDTVHEGGVGSDVGVVTPVVTPSGSVTLGERDVAPVAAVSESATQGGGSVTAAAAEPLPFSQEEEVMAFASQRPSQYTPGHSQSTLEFLPEPVQPFEEIRLLGYPRAVNYHQVMHPVASETRELLLFLVNRLPAAEKDASVDITSRSQASLLLQHSLSAWTEVPHEDAAVAMLRPLPPLVCLAPQHRVPYGVGILRSLSLPCEGVRGKTYAVPKRDPFLADALAGVTLSPPETPLSPGASLLSPVSRHLHIRQRKEKERERDRVRRSIGCLRAGLMYGPGGSSGMSTQRPEHMTSRELAEASEKTSLQVQEVSQRLSVLQRSEVQAQ
ncbi:hypothetical protein KIPB_004537, partial [Kipferlia bialata]|eukprot:g4537.t1